SIQKPYGIDAHLVADEVGGPSAVEDTTPRPAYRTDAGRTVYGGGGIHPDLVMAPDTLTLEERTFLQAVQQHFQAYVNTRLSFAVQYLRENPDLQPGFAVTP